MLKTFIFIMSFYFCSISVFASDKRSCSQIEEILKKEHGAQVEKIECGEDSLAAIYKPESITIWPYKSPYYRYYIPDGGALESVLVTSIGELNEIDGFNYEWGFDYKIRIQKHVLLMRQLKKDGGEGISYHFLKLEEKKPTSQNCFDWFLKSRDIERLQLDKKRELSADDLLSVFKPKKFAFSSEAVKKSLKNALSQRGANVQINVCHPVMPNANASIKAVKTNF